MKRVMNQAVREEKQGRKEIRALDIEHRGRRRKKPVMGWGRDVRHSRQGPGLK